jgi:tetratricopeptide (TPR) repeat protein
MLLALGAAERAMPRAEAAIALDGAPAGAWALRGRIFRRRGELDRALADFQQALRFQPNAGDLLIEVAELQYQLGRPQRCLSTLEHLLQSSPPGEEPRRALWLAGLAYGAAGRHDDAVVSLYAASVRGQPEPELLCQLAQAQSAAGRHSEALATARQAVAVDAGGERSRALLARLETGGVPGVDAPLRR